MKRAARSRQGVVAVAVVVGLFGLALAYAVFSPFLALVALGDAISSGDEAALSRQVDFPAVRQDIKAALKARLNSSKLGGLASMLAGDFIADRAVEALVTPSGLAALARGRLEPDASSSRDNAFQGASLTRDALDRFSVSVPTGRAPGGSDPGATNSSGQFTRFLFRLEGLTWRLSKIVFP